MGKTPTGERKYQIETIWPQHKEVMRRLLLGEKHVAIARALNVTPAMVSYTANSYLVQKELAILNAKRNGITVDIANDIRDLNPIAVQRLGEILMNGGEKDSDTIKVAFGILDRDGHTPIKRSINFNGTLTPEDIEDLKKRAREKYADSRPVTNGNGAEEAEVVE